MPSRPSCRRPPASRRRAPPRPATQAPGTRRPAGHIGRRRPGRARRSPAPIPGSRPIQRSSTPAQARQSTSAEAGQWLTGPRHSDRSLNQRRHGDSVAFAPTLLPSMTLSAPRAIDLTNGSSRRNRCHHGHGRALSVHGPVGPRFAARPGPILTGSAPRQMRLPPARERDAAT